MLFGGFETPPSVSEGYALMVHTFNNGAVAMTKHPVDYNGQTPEIGAGNAFSYDDLDELVQILQNRREDGFAMLPNNVLGLGARQLVWYDKGGVLDMWFKAKGKAFSLRVPWPALVYVARQRAVAVAALASDRRPTPSTRLFHAPLFNIYRTGWMCAGSVELPDNLSVASIPAWQASVQHSCGTHVNHEHTLRISAKNEITNAAHLTFWRQLHRSGAKRFPKQHLAPMGMSLARFVQQTNAR